MVFGVAALFYPLNLHVCNYSRYSRLGQEGHFWQHSHGKYRSRTFRVPVTDGFEQIFSKSYCPYCIGAKDLFDDINVNYKALELNDHKDGESIQKVLAELTQQNTVPNIFVNQQHIGGSDALKSALASGKLAKILKEAGINAKL